MKNLLQISIFLAILGFLACENPNSRSPSSLPYVGLLHVNSCMGGASFLAHEEKPYKLGSKSLPQVNALVQRIAENKEVLARPISSSGCEKVYQMKFNGEFEKEFSLTGYGNDEIMEVVQIYQFQLI